jgi:hypothetical protein
MVTIISKASDIRERAKQHDWSALRAMTDERIQAGIDSDPDATNNYEGIEQYYAKKNTRLKREALQNHNMIAAE